MTITKDEATTIHLTALYKLACLGNGASYGNSESNMIAIKALAATSHIAPDAALNEEVLTLRAALSAHHGETATLRLRIGQLGEALRLSGAAAIQAEGKASDLPPMSLTHGQIDRIAAGCMDTPRYFLFMTKVNEALAKAAAAKPRSVVLTLRQAHKLVEFFGGHDTLVTVTEPGPDWAQQMPGLYAFCTEYPEDGAEYLGETEVDDELARIGLRAVTANQAAAEPVPTDLSKRLREHAGRHPANYCVLMREAADEIDRRATKPAASEAVGVDTERLNWLEANHGQTYRFESTGHWRISDVFAPLAQADTLREAIDAARHASSGTAAPAAPTDAKGGA